MDIASEGSVPAISALVSESGTTGEQNTKTGGDFETSQNTAECDPTVMQDWAPPVPNLDALGRPKGTPPVRWVWAAEHDEVLRHQIEVLRKSYTVAVAEINKRFGTSYTRNSAIGRGHRLKLHGNPTGTNTGDPILRRQNREARRRERRANARAAISGQPRRPLPYLVRCVAVEPLGITFEMMAADQNTCKWPGDEYPYTYCGHPRHGDQPYCLAHHLLGTETPRRLPAILVRGCLSNV